MYDKILEKFNLKYEELSKDERAVIDGWVKAVDTKQMTLESVRGYVTSMRESIELELNKESMKRPSFWAFLFNFRQDVALKARLRNYVLIESFLSGPEKARKQLDLYLETIKPVK